MTEELDEAPRVERWLATLSQPGHAQIFRMHAANGSQVEQLSFDERVNWFPHLSPDAQWLVYLSYPKGAEGHPPDKDVELRLMSPEGGDYRVLARFFGGQGTINVNFWSPDSRQLAFVSYPVEDAPL